MKRINRFWPLTIYIVALIALMALMTLMARVIDDRQKLVMVDLVITLFAAGAIAFLDDQLRRDVKGFLSRVSQQLSPGEQKALSGIPLPAAIIGRKGELVWYNELFLSDMLGGVDALGTDIRRVNKNVELSALETGGEFPLRWDKKWYSCSPTKCGDGRYAVYFTDITELKQTQVRFEDSRPTVMLVVFDNEDELLKVRESERMRVIAEVDALINKWAGSVSGICWADARDKSLVVLEEKDAKSLIDARFSILQEARSIVVEDGTPVTLSIGVGRGGSDIEQCEAWALSALDMALGRGGDQAVMREGDQYSFFGGVSNSSERQSKVRMRMLASALSELLIKADNCIIMGHEGSDLDAIGAAIGVCALARNVGKEVFIAVEREKSLAGSLINYYSRIGDNAQHFVSPSDALDHVRDGTLLIIVDVHLPARTESETLYRRAQNVVLIDHHRLAVGHIDNAKLLIHEPYASSTCEIVTELATYTAEKAIGKPEAEALLAGIMLDTKNYALRTGVRTFEASAFLRKRGADTVEVRRLFSESQETYVQKGRLVSKATVYNGCAISSAGEGIDNIRIISSQAADDMLSISGVNASFVLYPTKGGVNISARSLGKVNVQLIMERLGGGGHLTMAAAQLKGKSMDEAVDMLRSAIDKKN